MRVPAPINQLAYSRARVRRRPAAGRRIGVILLLAIAVVGLGYGGYRGVRFVLHRAAAQGSTNSHAVSQSQLGGLTKVSPNTTNASPAAAVVDSPTPSPPAGAVLPVPYTVQAPFGNWKVHEESCEEAAVLMYHDFLEGDTRANIPPAEADQQLRALKAWQVTNWGAERDLTIDKTGQLAQAYYPGHKYQVIQVTQDSIKAAIAAGHPVVVPVMTHSLQNSHYGPHTVYHELLIKGYTSAGVVTNDAGVQEGKDWFYSWSVLFGAIDAQSAKMSQGRLGLILTK